MSSCGAGNSIPVPRTEERNCPRAQVTGLPRVSLSTYDPPITHPPGGQGLVGAGPGFYHTFIFLVICFRRRGAQC